MAQFKGPRHRLHPAVVRPAAEADGLIVEAEDAETAPTTYRGWFDSSWELRKGLDVSELPAALGDQPGEGRPG